MTIGTRELDGGGGPAAWADFTDDEVVERIDAGQAEEAIAELQRRYGARIHGFVRSLLHDDHLAQDATIEVFERVFLKSHLYQPGTSFRAWLFEIARNQALSAIRLRQRSPRPVSSVGTGADGEEATDLLEFVADSHHDHREPEAREFMRRFQTALEDLPPHYRSVFELCVRQGLSYEQAGKQLGLPTGTIAIRIMRARRQLYQRLSRHLGRLRRPPACFQ